MARTTIARTVITLAAAGLVVGLTACGNATESGIEQLIESQGGGDVDLDLDGDGGFSVQTEEGGMTIDEDGNLSLIHISEPTRLNSTSRMPSSA